METAEVSQVTRNKYTVLGALILVVSFISAAMAGINTASVTHSVASGIAVGVVWFCLMLCLNYMMAQIIGVWRNRRFGFLVAVPAVLVLGVLMSAVNSNFMLLRMMDTEIRQTLQAHYQTDRAALESKLVDTETMLNRELTTLTLKREAAVAKIRSEGGAELVKLQADVADLSQKYQIALNAVTVEVDGRGNSRQVGDGSRARQKRAEAVALKELLDAATARLAGQTARLDPAIRGRINEVNTTYEADKARLQDEAKAEKDRIERNIKELDLVPRDGFINRDLALWELVRKDPHFLYLFMALFFAIEIMVAFVKWAMGRTDYDRMLEAEEAEKAKLHSEKAANSTKARLLSEYEAQQAAVQHRINMRNLLDEERRAKLAAEGENRTAVEAYLSTLKGKPGVTEEFIDDERTRLTREMSGRRGLFALVGGRK